MLETLRVREQAVLRFARTDRSAKLRPRQIGRASHQQSRRPVQAASPSLVSHDFVERYSVRNHDRATAAVRQFQKKSIALDPTSLWCRGPLGGRRLRSQEFIVPASVFSELIVCDDVGALLRLTQEIEHYCVSPNFRAARSRPWPAMMPASVSTGSGYCREISLDAGGGLCNSGSPESRFGCRLNKLMNDLFRPRLPQGETGNDVWKKAAFRLLWEAIAALPCHPSIIRID